MIEIKNNLEKTLKFVRPIVPEPIMFYLRPIKRRILGKININTKEYWNNVYEKEGLDGRGEDSELLREIFNLIPERSKVLDIGCGNGRLLKDLIDKKNCTCTGLDMSNKVLLMLKKSNIEVINSILPDIPCHSNIFDVVTAIEVLEHLDKPVDTLKQMYHVTKKDGLIIYSVPDGNVWGNCGEHMDIFNANKCLHLLRPFVKRVHILALTDIDLPHFICYGNKKV